MSNITVKQLLNANQFGGAPYGNEVVHKFTLTINASGIVVGGDAVAAVGIGDVVRFGVIPAGTEIHDALFVKSTAATATSTAKVGFLYVDGVDDANAPQSDAYFINTAEPIATAGRTAMNNAAAFPITLAKDAYVVLTNQVAAQAKASRFDLLVRGANRGIK